MVLKVWAQQLDRAPRSGAAAYGLMAPCPHLHQMRLRKGPDEIERLREAGRISAEAIAAWDFQAIAPHNLKEEQGEGCCLACEAGTNLKKIIPHQEANKYYAEKTCFRVGQYA